MRRVLLRSLLLVTMVSATLFSPAPVSALSSGSDTSDAQVIVVLAPYLTWADINPVTMPALSRLLDRSALANLNVANRNREATRALPTAAALTISAGTWAAADPLAPEPFNVTEYYEGGPASEAYERTSGVAVQDNEIVYLGISRNRRFNEANPTLDVRIGSLGQGVLDAGGQTAAVGNADRGYMSRGVLRNRPAALLAMDAEGRVRFGDVSPGVLVDDPDAPFGYRTDVDGFREALLDAHQSMSAIPGPDLIVLDSGDMQRAYEFEPEVAIGVAQTHRRAALATLDEIIDAAVGIQRPNGTVLVVPHLVANTPGEPAGLAPLVIAGSEWSGLARSSSTQRDGLVTNMDITVTVLDLLGAQAPVSALGNPMSTRPARGTPSDRIPALAEMDISARAVDAAKPPVLNGFIAFTTLILFAAAFVLLRASRWSTSTTRSAAAILRSALLFVLAVPPASLLMFLFDTNPTDAMQATSLFLMFTAGLGTLGVLVQRVRGARLALGLLSLVGAVTLLVDQWLGGPLSFGGFLSYSPLAAARYYGLGNEGAALLMGSMLVGMAFLFDEYSDSRATLALKRWGIPLIGLAMVVTSAAPFLGANVGVVAWGVVGFAVLWALMNGYRITWKLIGLSVLGMIVLIALFSLLDIYTGDGQTHLGRAWASAGAGGLMELWLIVARKAETNIRVLTRTNWSYLLIAVLAFLGFMRWRPQGDFAATLDENPHFSAAMAACLVSGIAAYVTEDSGIVIPALIMLYVGAGILHLMLSRLTAVVGGTEG